MNFSRLGFVLVAFGAASFVLDYYEITTPLKLALVYFGGLGVFGGGLFACVGVLQRWRTPNARSNLLVDAVWTTVSIALIVSIGSFLVLTQTQCFSPFLRAETCNLDGYYVPMYAGLVVAAAGLGIIVYGRISRRYTLQNKFRQ
jgi:vacuolar-type H+-ATPase subunit I/STV1